MTKSELFRAVKATKETLASSDKSYISGVDDTCEAILRYLSCFNSYNDWSDNNVSK